MHDRRLDGVTYTFGNQGALYLNAMTWWDHETGSVWSQPYGRALSGPLQGRTLDLVPASLAPWKTWRDQHPHTRVLQVERGPVRLLLCSEPPRDTFVMGVTLGEDARALDDRALSNPGVVNDVVRQVPVLAYVSRSTRFIGVYMRRAAGQALMFEQRGEGLVDRQTGTYWNPASGLALTGPLQAR